MYMNRWNKEESPTPPSPATITVFSRKAATAAVPSKISVRACAYGIDLLLQKNIHFIAISPLQRHFLPVLPSGTKRGTRHTNTP